MQNQRNLYPITTASMMRQTRILENARYLRWKKRIDQALAAILLLPGVFLIGILMLLMRLSSRGHGIFQQSRVGLNGKVFTLYKIRTMVHDAELGTGAVWCKKNDSRVTWLGKILRRFHLDELPQLFNVLKGEMSLVGPRPERPEFVHLLAQELPDYCERLAVLPGITGLAQVNLPPDSDMESVRRKLTLDLEYIENIGFSLDMRLLATTLLQTLKIPESWTLSIFGVRRVVVLPLSRRRRAESRRSSRKRAAA